MLNTNSAAPLYLQLKEQLYANIRSGLYAHGQKIPTETQLAEIYKISRITVRKALKELENEGLVVRLKGKGTFISDHSLRRDISQNSSFSAICRAMNKKPGAKTIRSILEDATAADAQELAVPADSKVVVLERIRYADDTPVAIELSRFPESFSFLIEEDLNNASMISILAEKYHIYFTGTSQKVLRLVYATYEQAHYLSLPKGYPLISIACTSYDDKGKPCHRSLQLIVGDKFELYV